MMSKSEVDMEGWGLDEIPDQPTSLRSPQERNLLQFSPFAGLGEAPPSSMGRFRRVRTTVSGSNGPNCLANLTSRQLSQLSSGNSGDETTPQNAGENSEVACDAVKSPRLERQDANEELDKEERGAAQSSGIGGFSNSLTLSLDQGALRGKQSSPRRWTQKEASYGDMVSDMEPSQITAHSKHDSGEHNSAPHVSPGGDADSNGSGIVALKGVTAALTKKLSQDGRVIRKISGLLSRSKQGNKMDSQLESRKDADKEPGTFGQKMEQGIPVRKGSLLGKLGRKERQPMRKRSFMKSPKIKAGRNKNDDYHAQVEEQPDRVTRAEELKQSDGPPSEKEIKVTAALNGFRGDGEGRVGNDGDTSITEDDLAKRAVQIEKFLNSVAFL